MRKNITVNTITIVVLFFVSSFLLNAQNDSTLVIKNLETFTRLYGYVRFFHPSDESANLDWDKFAIAGVEEILKCKNKKEFLKTLKNLFLPIAPTIQFVGNGEDFGLNTVVYERDTTNLTTVAWQHYGVWLSENSSSYRSYRIFNNAKLLQIAKTVIPSINTIDKNPQENKYFDAFPKRNEKNMIEVSNGYYCNIPLVLYADSLGTLGKRKDYPFSLLLNTIDTVDVKKATTNDLRVRLADIIILWNIYQHFYPYFDVVNVDWKIVLQKTLSEVISNRTPEEFNLSLCKMTAQTFDGHSYVNHTPEFVSYILPVRAEIIKNSIVITSSDNPELKKGSVVLSIDGESALNVLKKEEDYFPGSRQYKQYWALNSLGETSSNKAAVLEVLYENDILKITVERIKKWTKLFKEFIYPPIKKIEDGIYYVNLRYVDMDLWGKNIEEIHNAKGVIYDFRLTSENKINNNSNSANLLYTILGKILNSDSESPKLLVPCFIYPDRREVSFIDRSWIFSPYSPHFNAKNVFIVESHLLSKIETVLGIIEQYKLGEIIGMATAGANGDTNGISLPGGFTTYFTGLKVVRQDGSQHHLIGIQPTILVQRTIKAVKEGKDEYLEKAIEILRK